MTALAALEEEIMTSLSALSKNKYTDRDDVFIAQNGLVLKLKKVSKLVIVDAGRKIKNPKVPVVFIPDKEREEENDQDPEYLQAVQDANYDRSMLVVTTLFALGTQVLEMPDDLAPPDDPEWFDVLHTLQITVPIDNARLRYAAWLKYIALTGDNEFNDLTTAVFRYSGMTTEADVQEAEDSFKSKEKGTPDTKVARSTNGQRRNINREY